MNTTFPRPLPPFVTANRTADGWHLSSPDSMYTLIITDEVFVDAKFADTFVPRRLREFCERIGKDAEFRAWEAGQ